MNLDAFPRTPLTFGPSPVHPLLRLSAHLGGAPLWAKRDDCNSGLAYGGNKTRKLEYLVADALAKGCDTLVSIGGVQSNHTRQVAAAAARTGLKCVLVQESWVDWPDVVYDRVGNIQLSRLMGADVRLDEAGFGIGFKESWERAIAEVEAAGRPPVRDPGRRVGPRARRPRLRRLGARGGAAGGARSASSSTRSSSARSRARRRPGMVAGFADQERERRVIGIDGSAKPAETLEQVSRIARNTAALLEIRELRDDELILDDRYHAGIYGIPDEQTLEAIRTGGAARGDAHRPRLRGEVDGRADRPRRRAARSRAARTVLYAHLGGQPALSAYAGFVS